MKQHQSGSENGDPGAGLPSVSPYELDVRVYLDAVRDGKFAIFLIGLAVTAITILYLIFATPIYGSNVLLQFMDKTSSSMALEDISDALATKGSVVDAEVEIIKSRRILGSVVNQLDLNIIIERRTIPIIGKYLLRRKMESQGLNPRLPSSWGGGKQRWGASEIAVDSLEVGSALIDEKLTLVPGKGESYKLFGPDNTELVEARIGERQLIGKSQSGAGLSPIGIDILISELDVVSDAAFYITVLTEQLTQEELMEELTVEKEGNDSGIIRISLEGENPDHIARILDAIVANYLAYNVGKKAAELKQMIAFVQRETPLAKQRMEQAETALIEYLSSHDSAGLTLEITKLVDRLTNMESEITELEIQKIGLQSRFTENHPAIETITRKIQLLESEEKRINQRLRNLPSEEREKETLSRDVEVAKELYVLLQSKEQELGVALSGITSTFQVIDAAQVSSTPIKPNRLPVLGAGIALGLFLGLLYVIGRQALRSS